MKECTGAAREKKGEVCITLYNIIYINSCEFYIACQLLTIMLVIFRISSCVICTIHKQWLRISIQFYWTSFQKYLMFLAWWATDGLWLGAGIYLPAVEHPAGVPGEGVEHAQPALPAGHGASHWRLGLHVLLCGQRLLASPAFSRDQVNHKNVKV